MRDFTYSACLFSVKDSKLVLTGSVFSNFRESFFHEATLVIEWATYLVFTNLVDKLLGTKKQTPQKHVCLTIRKTKKTETPLFWKSSKYPLCQTTQGFKKIGVVGVRCLLDVVLFLHCFLLLCWYWLLDVYGIGVLLFCEYSKLD